MNGLPAADYAARQTRFSISHLASDAGRLGHAVAGFDWVDGTGHQP